MKKKLLITMGCSVTQGYGSWDYSIVPDNKKIWKYDYADITSYEKLHLDIFLKNSWPYKLQRLIKFDKLINFGINGSSASHQVKAFTESLIDEYFEEYDVTLIWLVTFSDRISFYNGGKLESYNSYSSTNLYKEYINEIGWLETDIRLEMLSYIKIIYEISNSRNWNFIFSTLDLYDGEFIKQYYPKSISENIYIPDFGYKIFRMVQSNPELKSKICDHPKELGYSEIANKIHSWILDNKPEFLNTYTPDSYESIAYKQKIYERYDGEIRLDIIDNINKTTL